MRFLFAVTIVLFGTVCWAESNGSGMPPMLALKARAVAREAYLYGFPMVMGYKTMVTSMKDAGKEGFFNQIVCEARLFTPEDVTVVTPNTDTPYCNAYVDVRAEPVVLTVPKIWRERFYHFQFTDLYTHNFAYVGTLTTGNDSGKYLLAGPDWKGKRPEGVTAVIRSENGINFLLSRTQLLDSDDLDQVEKIQGSYDVQPLSTYLGTGAPATPPLPDFPEWVEGSQFDERFFQYLNVMLKLVGSPGKGEESLWKQLARLGIGANGNFNFSNLPLAIQSALKAGVQDGSRDVKIFLASQADDQLFSAKLFGTRDFLTQSARENYGFGNSYLIRAAAALIGLYGNSASEAMYASYLKDSTGRLLLGSRKGYKMVFKAGELPPVSAFWSLSMYDGETQLFVANPLDRYVLNSSMMDNFKTDDDGALELSISNESPSTGLESNWLPAPSGRFYMILRLYGPQPRAIDGQWLPPAVQRL